MSVTCQRPESGSPTVDQTLDTILRGHRGIAFLNLFGDIRLRTVLDFIVW